MPQLHRPLATVRALMVPVLTSMVLSLGGLVLVRWLVPHHRALLAQSNDVAGGYLQTVGSIYAVLLAFVVFVVWSQFNEARDHVEREANTLRDLARTVQGLPEAVSAEVHRLTRLYVDAVLAREWTAMAGAEMADMQETWDLLERMWDVLHRIEPTSERHKLLLSEALARFNDLSDNRTNRLASSRMRIPLALKILLYSGAITLVGSMYLFGVELLSVHAIMTAAMSGAIAHVLYIIGDLDDCFAGDWKVSAEPFREVRRYLDGPLALRRVA